MTNPGTLQTPKLEVLANGSDSSADSYDDDDEADNKTIYYMRLAFLRETRLTMRANQSTRTSRFYGYPQNIAT